MKKLVLSYGAHQIVNYLPTVKYCTNYFSTKKNIDFFNNKKISKFIYDKSKKILLHSIYKSSFEVKKYSEFYNDSSILNKYKNSTESSDLAFINLCKILNV